MAEARTKDPVRVLTGRLGALTVHSRGRTNTEPARLAFNQRFYRDIPEDLPQAERDRRAAYARQAHFVRLAIRRHHGPGAAA